MPTDGGIYWRLTRFSRKTRTQVKHGNNAVIAVNAAVVTWHHLWNVIELLRVANRESICNVKANSHRHARNDKKTVLSVSRPLRRCELDSRQLKTVADRKFEA